MGEIMNKGGYGVNGVGGCTYGEPILEKICFGSGGGQNGNMTVDGNSSDTILIYGDTYNFTGSLSVTGSSVNGNPGASGLVKLFGDQINIGTVNVDGISWAGDGRSAAYSSTSYTGTTQPGYLENMTSGENITDFVFSDSFETSDLLNWNSSVLSDDIYIESTKIKYGDYSVAVHVDDS